MEELQLNGAWSAQCEKLTDEEVLEYWWKVWEMEGSVQGSLPARSAAPPPRRQRWSRDLRRFI